MTPAPKDDQKPWTWLHWLALLAVVVIMLAACWMLLRSGMFDVWMGE